MKKRPVIKLILSPLEKKLETGCIFLLILMWLLTIYTYFNSPDIIPIHFNAAGKVDSYGSKLTLWLLPAIATLIYAGITWLNKYPHNFNYLVSITEENAGQQYTSATRLFRFLKIMVLLVFTLIILLSLLVIQGYIQGLGPWFLPAMLLLMMLLPMVYYVAKSLKSR